MNLYVFLKKISGCLVPVNSDKSSLKIASTFESEDGTLRFKTDNSTLASMTKVERSVNGGIYANFTYGGTVVLPENTFGLETVNRKRSVINSFVKNGELLVDVMYFYHRDEELLQSLEAEGHIQRGENVSEDGLQEYAVCLGNFDLYNKEDTIDAPRLFEAAAEKIEWQIKAKVIKHLIDKEKGDDEPEADEQTAWLKSVGVGPDFFSPSSKFTSEPPKQTLDTKFASFSSIPSINEYYKGLDKNEQALKAGKKVKDLKPSLQAIGKALEIYDGMSLGNLKRDLKFCNTQISFLTSVTMSHISWNLLFGGAELTGSDDNKQTIMDIPTTAKIDIKK